MDLMALLVTGVKSKGMEDFLANNDYTSERVSRFRGQCSRVDLRQIFPESTKVGISDRRRNL
jgi:hypothetical protein